MDIAPQKTACAHLTKANYRENLQGALVYKDQCGKCFHDPVTKLFPFLIYYQ